MLSFAELILIFLLSMVLTRLVCAAGRRWRCFDKPDGDRKRVRPPIVTSGGLAICCVFWIASFLAGTWEDSILPVFIGSVIVACLGLLDDRVHVGPLVKLAGQMVAAIVVVVEWRAIEVVTLSELDWTALARGLWLVFCCNAINLTDGIDGLAGAVTGTAGVLLSGVALALGVHELSVLFGILSWATAGFLVFNWPPASIYMGDTGSMFLGFTLGALSLRLLDYGTSSIALPVVASLVWPVAETVKTVIRRYRSGQGLFRADRGHIHDVLLAAGWEEGRISILAVLTSGCLGLLATVVVSGAPMLIPAVALSVLALIVWRGAPTTLSGEETITEASPASRHGYRLG